MRPKLYLLALAPLVALSVSAYADSVTTTFTSDNQFDGNMFNVTVGAVPLTVTGLAVNIDAGATVIDVYDRVGGYVGHETDPSAWTLVSSSSVTGLGPGNATPVAVTPFSLSGSTEYGFYVTISGNANSAPYMYYTNGANTYTGNDITLDLGIGLGGYFGDFGTFDPRTWNGTIDYTVGAATSATPEPESLVLTASGLSSLLFAARKRFRRS